MARKQPKELIVSQIADDQTRFALTAQPEFLWPTRNQFQTWSKWIRWDMEPDPQGWWYGYCPVTDADKQASKFSAMFRWQTGSMRCFHEPPCHAGKKAISLNNVALNMQWHAATK